MAKKIPLRQCLGCNEMIPKKELIRIVKDNENNFAIDLTGKMNGRGAYICRKAECLDIRRSICISSSRSWYQPLILMERY